VTTLRRVAALACWLTALAGASAQSKRTDGLLVPAAPALAVEATGEQVYRAACLTCHGPDGTGASRALVGFDTPLPDFTDCAFASAEADADWHAVIHQGGPIRGLARRMPAFGDALSDAHIEAVVRYIRGFCVDASWPAGDLNLPRALFTEKAFPENEVVYTSTIARGDEALVGHEVVYERRLGARNQVEAVMPVDRMKHDGAWTSGLGDVALAFRRTIVADRRRGTVAAAGGEVAFPTGDATRGLGNGYYVVEPFAMVGQLLPHNAFLQAHGGLEVPSDRSAPKEAYLRTAAGFTYLADRSFGRAWSPQVELLFAKPFGGAGEWDVVPQMQVTLSKIQHVSVAGGVRIPLSQRSERSVSVVTYLLWDWFDGPFTRFWK
jgi:mono/diheme cytochrome c family protein